MLLTETTSDRRVTWIAAILKNDPVNLIIAEKNLDTKQDQLIIDRTNRR